MRGELGRIREEKNMIEIDCMKNFNKNVKK